MYQNEVFEDIESESDLTPEAREVIDLVDFDHLVDRLEGRDGGLRPSKPQANGDNGLTQYVWRMARFHSGADTSIPVTAAWDLDSYLESEGIEASVSGITDTPGDEITGILDVVAMLCTKELGHDPNTGFDRWRKAIYG